MVSLYLCLQMMPVLPYKQGQHANALTTRGHFKAHRYNDAGPSTQGKQLLQQYGQNMHQESGQQDPSLQLNENSNHLNQGNILIDQSSTPAQLNTPSHNNLAVQEDDLITGANLSVRHNGNLSSLTDAAGTSHPVTDGAIQQNPMYEYGQIDEVFVGLSSIGEWVEPHHGHMAYQGFLPDNNDSEFKQPVSWS